MTTVQQAETKSMTSKLIAWSGLAAVAGGLIFAGIQPIHPPDVLASVTTGTWAVFMQFKLTMCLFFLIGITGLYARQANKAGWLGFVGFAMLIVMWFLQSGFIFVEAYVLPMIATTSPQFVETILGVASGAAATTDIGVLPAMYGVMGLLYMAGGLVFGIATVRAGVLPRLPAIVLAVAATVTPAAVLLPHAIQRLAGMPVGLAIAWLGFMLWSGLRTQSAHASHMRAVAAK